MKALQAKLLQKEAIIAEQNIEIQGLQNGINEIFATIEQNLNKCLNNFFCYF